MQCRPDEPSVIRDFAASRIDLDGRGILITGGTGSFGRKMVETLLAGHALRRLVVFSRDEFKQVEMERDLSAHEHAALRYVVGDVRDRDRLRMAMRGIDIVFHAAALKHVPTAEYNPIECIQVNVLGAENVIQAAIDTGVEKVIALSSDKAVSPISLYGASKLASDKLFIAGNALADFGQTRFSVVRYGNMIGSRGSVIPLFRRLAAKGAADIPITDPRMTRFWITLRQAIHFTLSCLPMMAGGEIFVPKIPSMRVVDLARCLAPDLPHRMIGIRPGEKLHDTMITEDDGRATKALSDRYVIEPQFGPRSRMKLPSGAASVPEGFTYSSDTNEDWLDPDQMRQLIEAS